MSGTAGGLCARPQRSRTRSATQQSRIPISLSRRRTGRRLMQSFPLMRPAFGVDEDGMGSPKFRGAIAAGSRQTERRHGVASSRTSRLHAANQRSLLGARAMPPGPRSERPAVPQSLSACPGGSLALRNRACRPRQIAQLNLIQIVDDLRVRPGHSFDSPE